MNNLNSHLVLLQYSLIKKNYSFQMKDLILKVYLYMTCLFSFVCFFLLFLFP